MEGSKPDGGSGINIPPSFWGWVIALGLLVGVIVWANNLGGGSEPGTQSQDPLDYGHLDWDMNQYDAFGSYEEYEAYHDYQRCQEIIEAGGTELDCREAGY